MAKVEVSNLSYKEYIEHPNDEHLERFLYVLRYSDEINTASNVFDLPTVYNWPFGLVKDVQYSQSHGLFRFGDLLEVVAKLKGAQVGELGASKVFDLRKQALWIASEIEKINKDESQLSGQADADEIEANSSELSGLGPYLQFSELAGNDVTKIEDVKQTPYYICFLELKRRKLQSEYDKRLIEIRTRNSKRKTK